MISADVADDSKIHRLRLGTGLEARPPRILPHPAVASPLSMDAVDAFDLYDGDYNPSEIHQGAKAS